MIDQALSSVILIGPYGSGKSTIAELIAPKLGVPHVSMDTEQHYYAEAGFDKEEFGRLYREVSQRAADLYFQSFFPAAKERPPNRLPVRCCTRSILSREGENLLCPC